jgi:hypothetical protein
MVCHLLQRRRNHGARLSSRRTRAAEGAQVQHAHLNCAVGVLLDQHSARLSSLRSVTRRDIAEQASERRRAAAAAVTSAGSRLGGAHRSKEAYRAP